MKPHKDIELYLFEIADSINQLERYFSETTFEEYVEDIKTQDAVNMRLHVIGEAVNKLPIKLREQFPDIPWHQIRGLRNIIGHDYYSLNPHTIYGIVRDNIKELEHILPELRKKQNLK